MIILFGGESRERLVSVATAQNMSEALPGALCWYWAPNDAVFEVTPDELAAHKDVFKTEFHPKGAPAFQHIAEALDSEKAKEHVFVLATHGGRGEDGTLQGWLEERGLIHTGSGSKACHLCMDKTGAKKVVAERDIMVSPAVSLIGKDMQQARNALHQMLSMHTKLILKPNWEGSSVGLMIVAEDKLHDVLHELKSHPDKPYLLEAFVEGIELTVGVVDEGQGARALVPTELRVQEGFADYDGKYLGLGTQEITPAEVPESVARAAQRIAVAAHDSLGCEGYSRTDMIVSEQGIVFLETNALPGMTRASLVPQALSHEGISIHDFLMKQVELARVRHS